MNTPELSRREFLIPQTQAESDFNSSFQASPLMEINTVKTKIIGVRHSIENYFKNETQYQQVISESPFIVSEYFGKYYFDKSNPDTPDETLLNTGRSKTSTEFYSAIARECARQGKDIYVVNPIANGWDSLHIFIDAPVLLYFLVNAFKIPRLSAHLLSKQITRKEFLHLFALTITGVGFFSFLDKTAQIVSDNSYPGNPLRWDYTDFRDLLSAQRFDLLTAGSAYSIEKQEIVPVIQGSGHTPGFTRYLQYPTLADIKINAYRHLEPLTNPTLRFTFNTQRSEWEEI